MYFSRITLGREAAKDPDFWRGRNDPYGLHRMVWRIFSDGPERKRDFIYRRDGRTIHAVSARPPQAGRGGWQVQNKPYRPKLRPGQRLFFTLRANPVRSTRDDKGRVKRHDVVMQAKRKLQEDGVPKEKWESQSRIAYLAGFAWLNDRAQNHGFAISPGQVRVDGHRVHRFYKKGRDLHIATLDFSGILQVTGPEAFTDMLMKGLGPAKSFGCGLMMVKGG